MKQYTKEQILKAAEISEVSMIDARHIVSLLDEAERLMGLVCPDCGNVKEMNNFGLITCLKCERERIDMFLSMLP